MSEKNNSNSQSEPDTMFNGSNEDYQGFTEGTSNYIKDLARTFSNESKNPEEQDSLNLERCLTSMSDVPGINPYTESIEHTQLDPESPEFNAKFWVKNIRKLYDSDPEYFRHSKLGVAYRNLRAYGIANDVDYQPTVTNYFWKHLAAAARHFRKEDGSRYFDILKPMDAIMRPGDLTVVLGRPGAGCSTLLKALAVNTYGFHLDKQSKISYDGLTQNDIKQHYRGDVIYSAETDVHFPMLTVNETLKFAARLSTPQNRGVGIDRESYVNHITSVYMATYGLLIARNTKVGNAFIQGCSGGERKRVSIAEVSLSGANLQCWDNATRGLDAATALEFIRALKTSSTILEATPIVSLYQCSQDAYDLFDNVLVLYEGYQIFFGSAEKAKQYFIDMGWKCPQRQTTADFLTSLTNPAEREPLPGYENKVPRTAKDFESYWKNSPEYTSLIKEIDEYFQECERLNTKKIYHEDHSAKQSKNLSANSPYTVSFPMQVRYILGRNWLRQKGNPSIPIVSIFAQLIMGLIISSVFYNQPPTTESFYYRGAALFFAVLFNALGSLLEILALFEARQIVEKHKKYALYRPAADAVASIISELPVKFLMSMSFNFVFYFMVNFRREPGRFFFYWFTCMWCMLVMSMLFRCIGSVFTSLPSAMTPASVVLLALIIYTGFVIPVPKMLGWSKWISYINPTYYVFESLMANEFHGRDFTCGVFIPTGPGYQDLSNENRVCSVVGGEPGSLIVSGTKYLQLAYDYHNSHRWRNIGIVIGYTLTLTLAYILLTEINKGAMQKGELVLFLRSSLPTQRKRKQLIQSDIETKTPIQEKLTFKEEFESSSPTPPTPPPSDSMSNKLDSSEIFFWRNLTYEISIKKQPRTILDHIDGWVKPGLVTALMGATGAGKTTLLNCLSERLTVGVITDGKRMVNGHSLDSSFRRSIGYVQQADLHLPTTTVREALQFSAYLRQSKSVSKQEKDKYVDYVIDLLEMNPYADALVGVTGEGLNVEQRKRLSIGVELVAKPKLLLFLDEPTSGLDSQTAWSICKLLRKLADHGQAILCTIHQPSALLMKEFDRLLFLQMGGQTVYFGDLGENCQSLIDYFEKYGADPCPKDANPAEWMLQVVGAAPGSHAKQDYFEVWRNSTEYQEIQNTLDEMERELVKLPRIEDPEAHLKYAVPLWKQYLLVSHRAIISDWRSPNYIYSKFLSTTADALFNGFSFFKADRSLQGLQNQMFSVFMLFPALNIIVQQMLPHYIQQREIFEAREASSRTFSWLAFISGQITSEIPFQVLVGTASFFCWYYPVGFYENAISTDSANQRGVLMWMFLVSFYVYATTLGHLCISFNEIDQNAFILAHLLLAICLMFCGVLAGPDKLPRFWIFMYRCNPFTYLMQGVLGTGLADNEVVCADYELVEIQPPSGMSCEAFMGPFVSAAGGYVETEPVSGNCLYCSMSSTNEFLTRINAVFSERWRNWALVVCFIGVNIILAIVFYWLARVPKGSREKKKTITLKDEEE
ncbi:uncharacterized protein J8A68_005945 [[Candida] subhashii]|uniref:ABC transporter domain-containing protein n=1 Tax=[Candida] subhashii TaxID=561895 RepID=A0A8J5UIV9_9ASCO|nr:uncharacterized protein J8A68_005945 [[Candida] subhashii]KAG7660526.1 hypothetical protein J8A68_005945 [[Candida] subhashii]